MAFKEDHLAKASNADEVPGELAYGMGARFMPLLEQALSGFQQQQEPDLGPAPHVASPLANAAAAFTATMAEGMGARGAIARDAQRAAQQRADALAFQQKSGMAKAAFHNERTMNINNTLLQMAQMKYNAAKEVQDFEQMKAALEEEARIRDKEFKREQQWEMTKMGVEHANELAEIEAIGGRQIKVAGAKEKLKRDASGRMDPQARLIIKDQYMAMFGSKISAIQKDLNNFMGGASGYTYEDLFKLQEEAAAWMLKQHEGLTKEEAREIIVEASGAVSAGNQPGGNDSFVPRILPGDEPAEGDDIDALTKKYTGQ
jgi:hypothetical protein